MWMGVGSGVELGEMNEISGREPHQSESEKFFPCLPFGALTQPLGFPCLLVPRREIRSVTSLQPQFSIPGAHSTLSQPLSQLSITTLYRTGGRNLNIVRRVP